MKIAVLGSGNGGCAVAFDWARMGHEVSLFDFEQFPATIAAVATAGGIEAEGELSGFAPVGYAGHDIGQAVGGADLVFAVGPAYSTQPFGEACKPHLTEGQTVVVCPSSCGGALVFKHAIGRDVGDDGIVVADTSTLPYAVRITEPGKIHIFLRLSGGVWLAALPSARTGDVLVSVRRVYDYIEPATNVLQTALQNGNPVIHPAVSLLNAALIERTGGDFCFYEHGVTPAVGRLMESVDYERIALGAELGVDVTPDPALGVQQGYMTEGTYHEGYAEAPGFKGIKAQESLDYRYFQEDVGYGMVFMAELGRQLAVPTPTMDALIHLVSVVMQRDYRAEGVRTMATLGLDGYSADELRQIL